MRDRDLWQRLKDYSFPLSGGRGTLQKHLVEKTRLNAEQSERAVNEYRRFLYLAALPREAVAPSPLIDRIWHTHIEDTRAYIEDFSPKVVGRVVHHTPGRARAADDLLYQHTLDLYVQEFGEAPFRKVWPSQGWLRGETTRGAIIICALIAAALLSPTVGFPLPFVAWPVTLGIAVYIDRHWGSWSIKASSGGGGCSSCGGGDGGCGGD